ncbi:hypothetical protein V6N13_104316 [Hibiscus sabdariffa]
MDPPRGRRGRRPDHGRGHERRADVIQDTLVITNPPSAPIGFQQVGGDAPLVQDPPVIDPPAHDPPIVDTPVPGPPVGGPLVGDPPVHVVDDHDDIDEVMVGCVVWRLLQRVVGPHLEAHMTTISERLLAAGASFFDGVSEEAPNMIEF